MRGECSRGTQNYDLTSLVAWSMHIIRQCASLWDPSVPLWPEFSTCNARRNHATTLAPSCSNMAGT